MGDVLVDMADEFASSWETDQADEWRRETESMTHELDTAWQSVKFARESRLANPRQRLGRGGPGRATVDLGRFRPPTSVRSLPV